MTKYAIIIVGSHEIIMRGSAEHFKKCLIKHGVKKDCIKLVEPKGLTHSKTSDEKVKEIFKDLYLFSLKPYYKQYLKDGNVNDRLKKEFEDNKQSLSSNAKVSKIDEKQWEIVDDKTRYRIEDTGTQLNIYKDFNDKKKIGPKDTIYLYLVGHGFGASLVLDVSSHGEAENSPLWKQAQYATIFSKLKLIPAANVNIIVDSCESGRAVVHLKRVKDPRRKYTIVTATDQKKNAGYWQYGLEKRTDTIKEIVAAIDKGSNFVEAGKKMQNALTKYNPQVKTFNPCPVFKVTTVSRDYEKNIVTVEGKVSYLDGSSPATTSYGIKFYGYTPVVGSDCKIQKEKKEPLDLFLFHTPANGSFTVKMKYLRPYSLYDVTLWGKKIFSDRLHKPKDAFYKELPKPVQVALYKEIPKHVQAALIKCYKNDLLNLQYSQILQPVIDTLKRLVSFAPTGNNYTPRMRDDALAELNSLYHRVDIKEKDLLKVLAVPNALRMDGYLNVILLMRDINKRQHALGISQSNWGMGGTPDGGSRYPPLNALNDVQKLTPFMRAVHNAICVLGLYPKGTLHFLRGYKVQYSPGY